MRRGAGRPGGTKKASPARKGIAKCPTGIRGLDEITGGGLPRGRCTLVCGGAGSGKSLMAVEFVVRGARDFGEPGVLVTLEETAEELAANVASLGFDLPELLAAGAVAVEALRMEPVGFEEPGSMDPESLLVRLALAMDSVGAQRVVVDSLEAFFSGSPSGAASRAELRRLFSWLKRRGATAVITAERGDGGTPARHGLEQFVGDCVICLDHRMDHRVAARRLRIVKYRGAAHGTHEYPVLIDESGLRVLPAGEPRLEPGATSERVSTGVPALDTMFGGQGYFRGSSVLVSGTAGTGKSSFAAAFLGAACERGERGLFVTWEESPAEMLRNLSAASYGLRRWVESGLLRFHAVRAAEYGLEQHFVVIRRVVDEFRPRCVVLDPVTHLAAIGEPREIRAMLTQLTDEWKQRGITSICTGWGEGTLEGEAEGEGLSSLTDVWLSLRQQENHGTWKRVVHILKSRGMAHSIQDHDFLLTSHGIQIEESMLRP